MEPVGLLQSLQESAADPYPEKDASTPHLPTLFP